MKPKHTEHPLLAGSNIGHKFLKYFKIWAKLTTYGSPQKCFFPKMVSVIWGVLIVLMYVQVFICIINLFLISKFDGVKTVSNVMIVRQTQDRIN